MPHALLLRRELGRLYGLRLRCGLVFRPLGLRNGSTSALRIGGSGLLPLTSTTIVSSVVGVTVGASIPFLLHSVLPVQYVWITIGHAPRGINNNLFFLL